MRLVPSAIERYRLTVLGMLLVLAVGGLSYFMIPRTEDPLIKVPGATVMVHYPGAGPRDVERHVSNPLEERINEIDDVDKITSTSSQGTSVIIIEFDPDSDMDRNMQELREKITEAEKELPSDALDPEITRHKTETVSLIVNLSGPFNYWDLLKFAKFIKRDLDKIPEIMSLEIEGNQEREVQVEIDEARLSQYRISLEEVIRQIQAENVSLPGGHMDLGKRRYLVRTDEEFLAASEIGRTIVGSYGGRPIFLADLAEIKDTYERPDYLVRFNGRQGINVLVTQKYKANLLAVSKKIRVRLNRLSDRLPQTLKVDVFADQSRSVFRRLADFQNNLLMGAGLVMLITWFLMNWRMASIVAFLLPLSMACAVMVLYRAGHTLNQITLTSMVIVLGMLVDNGIVVVENIQRHLGMGKKRLAAALDGSSEVLGAITSSTLTTVLAFSPLLFMTRETGQFVRGIPLTMISALAGSLLVAIFATPLLSYRFLKQQDHKQEKENRILRVYGIILKWALRHKFTTMALASVAVIGSLLFIPKLGLQFFPKAEKGLFIIEIKLPQGTNINTTLDLGKKVEQILLRKKGIEDVMSHVGQEGPRIYYNINFFRTKSPHKAQFFVTVPEGEKGEKASRVISELRPTLERMPGARIELKELEQGPPVGAPVAIKFKGDDMAVLERLAQDYKDLLESIPGTVDVSDDASEPIPQVRIRVDTDKARLLGVSNAAIAQTLRTAVYGTTATSFRLEDEEIDVIVSLGETSRNDLGIFNSLYLKSVQGFKIPFRQVADIQIISDIGAIHRENLTRTVTARSEVQGRLAEDIVHDLKAKATSLEIPAGYHVEYEGETKERTESFMSLGWAMVAAFMLVYIVLVAQFNSYKQPLTIALSLPFGLVGAVLGLWLTGYSFGFMAFLGVVSLTGIVVNDAIVLIDFINVLRRKGTDMRSAVTEAGKLRFRPVMLTTLSTVGGLMPLAIRGGSLWGPMCNVIIFGLSMATILTLIIIPVMYEILEGK